MQPLAIFIAQLIAIDRLNPYRRSLRQVRRLIENEPTAFHPCGHDCHGETLQLSP